MALNEYFRYLDMKVFQFLQRDYPDVLWTSGELLKESNFKIRGKSLPLISLWREKPVSIVEGQYGRSVLKRPFEYKDVVYSAQFVDLEMTFQITAASIQNDYLNQIDSYLLQLDMQRYFDMDFSDLFDGLLYRVEFMKDSKEVTKKTMDFDEYRLFTLSSSFILRCTLPYIESIYFLERIRLLLSTAGVQIEVI